MLPTDLVFVRHAESEANVVQRAEKAGRDLPAGWQQVYERTDADQRLSLTGVEQAETCKLWLRENDYRLDSFIRFVSTHIRAMETAALIGPQKATWFPDVNLVERDWGVFGATPHADRAEKFAEIHKMLTATSFYTRFPGGESIYDLVSRVRLHLTKLLSVTNWGQPCITVTHGEFMWAVRFVMEEMLPLEWESYDADKSLRIGNCCVLHYSRKDPDGGDTADRFSNGWRRMVNTIHPEESPYNGEWVRLKAKSYMPARALMRVVESRPNLL